MIKKNFILLLIFLGLLAVVLFYKNYWLIKERANQEVVNFLSALDIKTVDKIIIKRGDQTTVLLKDGERWRVDGADKVYAKQLLLDSAFSAWQTAAGGKIFLVSEDQAKQADLQTDGHRLQVEFFAAGKSLLSIAIGLKRAGYTYVAMSGDTKTYEVTGDLLSAFDYEEWKE